MQGTVGLGGGYLDGEDLYWTEGRTAEEGRMGGGSRRGVDFREGRAGGAKAVLVGRAPLWGLGAFGQPGVERVLWMLNAELKLAMGLSGQASVAAIPRKLAKRI